MSDRAEGIAEELKRLVRQVSDASYTQGADERYDSEIKDRRNDEKVSALLRQSSAAIDRLISIMAERQAGEAVALQPLSDEYKPDALRWREAKRFRVGDESGGVGIWYEKQRVWVTGDLADSLADGQIAQRFFDEHGCWPCHASDEQLAGTDAEHLQPPYGRDRGITKDTTK